MKPVDILSAHPLFSGLDTEALERLCLACVAQHYAAGETVFLQGDPCKGLYIVREGWVKGIITSLLGREQIIFLLRPGDIFNEIGLLTDGGNMVTTQALEETTLWIIQRKTMLQLMDEHPRLSRAISQSIAERVLQLMKLVEDLSLRTVKSRMARIMLENSVEGMINRRRWMTQTEMAARLGTVLDVANRTLNSLEADRLISVSRFEIQILDRKKLEELASIEE